MRNPKLLASLSIILWSFGGYLTKLISIRSQFLLLSLSFTFTFISLFVYNLVIYRSAIWDSLKTIKPRYFMFGVLGYFVYWIGLVQGTRSFGTVSEITILNYTWPVFTVLFTGLFFHTDRKRTLTSKIIEWIGITLGLSSVVILSTQGNVSSLSFSNLPGLAWGLLAGISYGMFSAYSSGVPKKDHSLFLLASIFTSWILMLMFSSTEFNLVRTLSISDIFVAAALGFLLDGIGYLLWTRANRLARERQISISSVASIMYLVPVISLIIVAILLREGQLFQVYFIISLLFVLAGSIICQRIEPIEQRVKAWFSPKSLRPGL